MTGGRPDVVDTEGEVVEPSSPEIRRMVTGSTAPDGSNSSDWISK
jgi:hypothetical protein